MMRMSRRFFLHSMAAAGVRTGIAASGGASGAGAKSYSTKLNKALIAPVADDANCERIAKAGFPGVELTARGLSIEQARQGRRTAEKHGLRIHSVMGGGGDFMHTDPEARRKSIDHMIRRIEVAAAHGASALLLVPGRVGVRGPNPAQFNIAFDPKTLRVSAVVRGDNAPFADYIAAQNRATELTSAAMDRLIPVAAREGVIIAHENVWNNLWVLPELAAAFVRSFDSPWVGAYLDLGNHVRYAPTEQWLRAFGSSIVKLHIKDFKIDRAKENDGEFVPIGRGSIDWKSVRSVIEEVGYNGWVTVEEKGYADAEYSALMDRFFAGQDLLTGLRP